MTKILKSLILTVLIASTSLTMKAGDGMWLPLLLKQLNEAEMQGMGMKLTAEDIYSINKGSLKDAIVHFGGFCTGEIISDQGLILTNHHCGYGQIQSHTTLENNYLENGFWAMDKSQELPNPGLFVKFIVRMEDVSKMALKGVTDKMDETERQSAIDKNMDAIKAMAQKEEWQDAEVKPFYKGNQYYMFITETYNDVRLVGAPPSSIGKFGADTDNWEFPRHTGDFSLFRVYAGPNNRPADYSPDNKPMKPKHFLPVSLDGVAQDDFTMVFGFPGRTNEYLPAVAVEEIMEVTDPARIAIRDKALAIVDEYMRADDQIKIQYASKFASIANYWKKWQGEVLGLKQTNALGKKSAYEKEFQEAIMKDKKLRKQYQNLLPELNELYASRGEFQKVNTYYSEINGRNIEAMRVASLLQNLLKRYANNGEDGYTALKARYAPYIQGLYKNYQSKVDKDVFAALIEMLADNLDQKYLPPVLNQLLENAGGDYSKMATTLYAQSQLSEWKYLERILEMDPKDAVNKLKADPIMQLSASIYEVLNANVYPSSNKYDDRISLLQRQYMKAQMEAFPNKRFYPDANSTLRVTYGKIDGFSPRDGVMYNHVTYLDGVVEKFVPGDYEFDVPAKLIELHKNKDYGQYTDTNGKVPVCILASNHTTGGNSGSPAIDAHGNLIGLNFDRTWQSTMSDYNYDASICRNIMVDARYILFIIDKYAGAGHLVEEMKLVHPKKK